MTLEAGDVTPQPVFAQIQIKETSANSGHWPMYDEVKMSTISPIQ